MDFGPDDLLALGSRYFLPLALTAICTAVFLLAAYYREKWLSHWGRWRAFSFCGAVAPAIVLLGYFLWTCGWAYTLVLLNSESSSVAERIYEGRFRSQARTMDAAVGLASSRCEAPNVRFYAACLIAEMLVTNDEQAVQRVLRKLEAAPEVETQFFGGNRLTEGFYTPGRVQPRLSVRAIVERRMQIIRTAHQN